MRLIKSINQKIELRDVILTKAFLRLSDSDAVVMAMHYLHGLKWERVAELTSYSVRNIYVIRNKCIEQLTDDERGWL